MECKEVRQLLGAYLDQALTDEEMVEAETHLYQCDACWQELSDLRDLQVTFQDPALQEMVLHRPSPLPVDFTDQVMARVMDERPAGVNLIWPWLRQKWSHRQYASVAYAMSATMVVVTAGNMLYLWNQTTDSLGVWTAQGQAYWEALQAHVGGTGGYVIESAWKWLAVLFQLG